MCLPVLTVILCETIVHRGHLYICPCKSGDCRELASHLPSAFQWIALVTPPGIQAAQHLPNHTQRAGDLLLSPGQRKAQSQWFSTMQYLKAKTLPLKGKCLLLNQGTSVPCQCRGKREVAHVGARTMQAATRKPANCNTKGKKVSKIPEGSPGIQGSNWFPVPWSQLDQTVGALATCFSSKKGAAGAPQSHRGWTHTLFLWLVVEQRGKRVGGTLTSKAVAWVERWRLAVCMAWACLWNWVLQGTNTKRRPGWRTPSHFWVEDSGSDVQTKVNCHTAGHTLHLVSGNWVNCMGKGIFT